MLTFFQVPSRTITAKWTGSAGDCRHTQLHQRCRGTWCVEGQTPARRRRVYVDSRSSAGRVCRAESDFGANRPVRYVDSNEVWSRLRLLTREIQIAALEEDYAMAARLRDESGVVMQQLPPLRQYMWGRLQVLQSGNRAEQLAAITNLGDTGDASIVPDMAMYLKDPSMQDPVETALWAIFHRHANPSVTEFMNQGCRLMVRASQLPAAKEMFTAITMIDPSYAEGWNKKATVEYVMRDYEASLEDCKMAIELQPFHWGALAGSVLCLMQLRKFPEALEACRATLAVNPGCDAMYKYQEVIQEAMNGEGGASLGGDFS